MRNGNGLPLYLPGKEGDPGRTAKDNRRFVEAVLWIMRAGTPWRDLPESFGKWGSVWKGFRRWALEGVFERIFAALSGDPDFDYELIDAYKALWPVAPGRSRYRSFGPISPYSRSCA